VGARKSRTKLEAVEEKGRRGLIEEKTLMAEEGESRETDGNIQDKGKSANVSKHENPSILF